MRQGLAWGKSSLVRLEGVEDLSREGVCVMGDLKDAEMGKLAISVPDLDEIVGTSDNLTICEGQFSR